MEASSSRAEADGAEELRRKDELRKAGEDYLAQALASANKGKDPFAVDPERVQKERRQRIQKSDPEFEEFGAFLKRAMVYIYVGLYVVCQAASYVLVKARK
jgi:hypothetical protein